MMFREEIETVRVPRLRVRNPQSLSLVLGLLFVWGWGAAEARAQHDFTLQLLPGPPGSGAASINKTGQIVGDNGNLPAFWADPDATTLTVLPVPPGPFGSFGAANSINDKGQIVGGYVGEAGFLPAFWESPDATAATMLPVPTGPFSPFGTALSINDKGQIVGGVLQDGAPFGLPYAVVVPVVWEGPAATAPTILPVPAGPFSPSGFAASINKTGQIVGSAGSLPAFWEGPDATAPTILPVPPGSSGEAISINDKGQIVGYVVLATGRAMPAFWEGRDATAPTILPFPSIPSGPFGFSAGLARSINMKGQIVGVVVQAGSPFSVSVPAVWEGPDATAPTLLAVPPGPFPSGTPSSINDKGQIVGRAGLAAAIWAEK